MVFVGMDQEKMGSEKEIEPLIKSLRLYEKRKPAGPNAHLFPGKQIWIWTLWKMLKNHLVILSSQVEKL